MNRIPVPSMRCEGPGFFLQQFVPTQFELLLIARYWYHEELQISFDWFTRGDRHNSETAARIFVSRRLQRIERILGEPPLREAKVAVESEFAEKIDSRLWNTFVRFHESSPRDQNPETLLPVNIRPKRAARVTHDAYGLGPLGASFLLIGSVDEVNGQGAVEVPEFVPTRFELKIVAEH